MSPHWNLRWLGLVYALRVCVCVCVYARGEAHVGDRKSTGAQKTNKQGPSISNYVLISPCYVQERSGAADSAAVTTKACSGGRPSHLPIIPLCFHLNWHLQGDECSGSFSVGLGGGGAGGGGLSAKGYGAAIDSLALGR